MDKIENQKGKGSKILAGEYSPTTLEQIKQKQSEAKRKGTDKEKDKALQRFLELKTFVKKLYCKKEIFASTVDYGERKCDP